MKKYSSLCLFFIITMYTSLLPCNDNNTITYTCRYTKVTSEIPIFQADIFDNNIDFLKTIPIGKEFAIITNHTISLWTRHPNKRGETYAGRDEILIEYSDGKFTSIHQKVTYINNDGKKEEVTLIVENFFDQENLDNKFIGQLQIHDKVIFVNGNDLSSTLWHKDDNRNFKYLNNVEKLGDGMYQDGDDCPLNIKGVSDRK